MECHCVCVVLPVPELAALGSSWLDADSSGSIASRHYLRAIVSSPLQLTINHTYDVVGAYQAFVTVSTTGDIVSKTSAGQAIDVQVSSARCGHTASRLRRLPVAVGCAHYSNPADRHASFCLSQTGLYWSMV